MTPEAKALFSGGTLGITEIDPYYLGAGAGSISSDHDIGGTASPTIDTLGYSHVTGDWLGSGA